MSNSEKGVTFVIVGDSHVVGGNKERAQKEGRPERDFGYGNGVKLTLEAEGYGVRVPRPNNEGVGTVRKRQLQGFYDKYYRTHDRVVTLYNSGIWNAHHNAKPSQFKKPHEYYKTLLENALWFKQRSERCILMDTPILRWDQICTNTMIKEFNQEVKLVQYEIGGGPHLSWVWLQNMSKLNKAPFKFYDAGHFTTDTVERQAFSLCHFLRNNY